MDISAIGRQFGLDDAQTRAALEALTPVVAAGMRRSASQPEGLQDILSSVLTGGRARSLEDENAVQFDAAKGSGDEILKQIFGSKDVSREVAQQLSATSGVGAAVLKKLLPIVASIVMGQVAKKMGAGSGSGGGGLGDILGDVLGGGMSQQQQPKSGGGLGDILGDILGGGASQQQQPKSGGGLGDILGDILGGGAGQEPAQQPRSAPGGSGGSLEDILGDILGGGAGGGGNGRVIVKQVPQDQMGDILKDIFGGNFPGGGDQPQQRHVPSDDAVSRGRKTLEDMLGGGTRGGSDADILLDSVDKAIRRR